jgi:hypothetical protein
MSADSALELFFRDDAVASVESPAARLPMFYAGSFIASGPRGSAVFKNDEKFVERFGQVHELNGGQPWSPWRSSLFEKPLSLSSRHLLLNAHWERDSA